MLNTIQMAKYDVETLTERIAENEAVYGPGCRPELRARLAAAQAIVTETEVRKITWSKEMYEDTDCQMRLGGFTAMGRTPSGEKWSAVIFHPATCFPVPSEPVWGVQIKIGGEWFKKTGSVGTLKDFTTVTVGKN